MTEPTFSIITAVRNGLCDLQRTCESLRAQTAQNFEWIVIDAASTDGTPAWLAGITDFGDRLHWISERDQGIADAWNKGLILCRGEHVLLLNAGDVYDPTLVECFSSAVGPDHVTCCHARLLTEDDQLLGTFRARPALLWRGMHLPHNWASVPLRLYKQFGAYRLLRHSMDFDWFHRYYKARGIHGFVVLNETLGSYRLGGHSDQHFREGFAANREILVSNGTPRMVASILQKAYTFKHRWFHR